MATVINTELQALFDSGVHVGLPRTRRHPSAAPFLFSTKDRADIFDLEKTAHRLEAASTFLADTARAGKTVLFVGGKNEISNMVKEAAERAGAPYVASRWIGGTLTNFKNIRKRVDRLETLMGERERGELSKYTKRERLLIDREIDELLGRFGGIVGLRDLPAALLVVDTRHEGTAVREANQLGIPVVGLSSSDGDFSQVQYPVPGNDTSAKSVRFIVKRLADAYESGKKVQVAKTKDEA